MGRLDLSIPIKKVVLVILLSLIAYGGYIFGQMPESPPIQFGYYIIIPQDATVSMFPGTDRSPGDGESILRNTTTEERLPTIYLGELPMGDVSPGQIIIYDDAFHIRNTESFDIQLIGFNFSQIIGTECLAFFTKNDTDGDGNPDGGWIPVWLGNYTFSPANGNQLNLTNYILFKAGGELPVKIVITVPETTSATDEPIAIFYGTGNLFLWFKKHL